MGCLRCEAKRIQAPDWPRSSREGCALPDRIAGESCRSDHQRFTTR
jgi:hypothetical protein